LTYLGLGYALWMEAAEHLQQVQLEHDLAYKAAVQTVQEEMEWVEEKCCAHKWEERW